MKEFFTLVKAMLISFVKDVVGLSYFSLFDVRYGHLSNKFSDSKKFQSYMEIRTKKYPKELRNQILTLVLLTDDNDSFLVDLEEVTKGLEKYTKTNVVSNRFLLDLKIFYGYMIKNKNTNGLFLTACSTMLLYQKLRKSLLGVSDLNLMEKYRVFLGTSEMISEQNFREERFFPRLFKTNRRYNIYKNILANEFNSFSDLKSEFGFNKRDAKFYSMINHKEICLVGPGHLSDDDLEAILNFETIVLINHAGYESTYSSLVNSLGGKLIINYISGGRLREMDRIQLISSQTEVSFSVFSDKRIYKRVNGLQRDTIKPLKNHDSLIEFGRWNFAKYVILDLLIYNVKNVSIFGVNMFLDHEPYSENYNSFFIEDKKQKREAIGGHNPILQFNLLKNLYMAGKITPNENLRTILDLECTEFCLKLEHLYRV